MNQRLFEDIMSQTYNEDICYNPSKIFLIKFLSEKMEKDVIFKIKDFQRYLYRLYIDNPDISSKHPSYIIRRIERYGITDLNSHVVDTFESWCRDAKNSVLVYNEHSFGLQIDKDEIEDTVKNLNRIAPMLYRKIYNATIPNIKDLKEAVIGIDDKNIELFGKGLFRNRVLEDIQYCPICEEIDTDDLVAVHIVDRDMGADEDDLMNRMNGMIFCRKHAKDFIGCKFYFDELGFVHNNGADDIENGMHLSFAVRSSQRKNYLARRFEYIKGKDNEI